jgi:hypothetical protein
LAHHVFYLTGSEIAGGVATAVIAAGTIGNSVRKRMTRTKNKEHMTMNQKVNIRNEGALRKLKEAMTKHRERK